MNSGAIALRGGRRRGDAVDLAIVSGVFVQVLDLELTPSYRYLFPHEVLGTDPLREKEGKKKRKERKG